MSFGRHLAAVATITIAVAAPAAARVIAIGDIHGAEAEFVEILLATGLVDADGNWAGDDTILVQTGDFTDRGPGVRAVMDRLIQLQDQAAAAGGEVVVLMGNHEQMNVMGVDRDASPEIFASFMDLETDSFENRDRDEWVAWWQRLASVRKQSAPSSRELAAEWERQRVAGRSAYRVSVAPNGQYGAWLRSLPITAIREGVLFIHAGLSPAWATTPRDEIEDRIAAAVGSMDASRSALIEHGLLPSSASYEEHHRVLVELGTLPSPSPESDLAKLYEAIDGFNDSIWVNEADSPLWYRGYAKLPDSELDSLVSETLAAHGVARIVAGHSPQKGSVAMRSDGRLFLIDTGMLTERYGGRPAALEIDGDRVRAHYVGETVVLVGEQQPDSTSHSDSIGAGDVTVIAATPPRALYGRDGSPLPFSDRRSIELFLASAPVIESKPIGKGVTGALKLTLERGPVQLRGAFHDIDVEEMMKTIQGRPIPFFVDSFRSHVAGYRLAELMGLDTVPPTVERRFEGKPGSVQLWIEGAADWAAITAGEAEIPGSAAFRQRQLDEMYVWDELVANIDRNAGNILFDRDGWIWWIDHTRAFSQSKDLPQPDRIRRCSRRLLAAMHALDLPTLTSTFGETLSKAKLKALLARRDKVVSRIDELVATRGAQAVLFELGPSLDPSSP